LSISSIVVALADPVGLLVDDMRILYAHLMLMMRSIIVPRMPRSWRVQEKKQKAAALGNSEESFQARRVLTKPEVIGE